MSSVHIDVRRGLEYTLSAIHEIPDIAYENISFEPTTGSSWVRPTFIPITRRPAVRGSRPQQFYSGIFRVDCFVAEGNGPHIADTLADDIMRQFEAATDITFNGKRISIEYAEREEGRLSSPWYFIPVNIGWYTYQTPLLVQSLPITKGTFTLSGQSVSLPFSISETFSQGTFTISRQDAELNIN
jgi:hypothetical protein